MKFESDKLVLLIPISNLGFNIGTYSNMLIWQVKKAKLFKHKQWAYGEMIYNVIGFYHCMHISIILNVDVAHIMTSLFMLISSFIINKSMYVCTLYITSVTF